MQRIVEQAHTDVTEQVIQVPKITCPDQTPRRALLLPADGGTVGGCAGPLLS